jgi:hypothetical protein
MSAEINYIALGIEDAIISYEKIRAVRSLQALSRLERELLASHFWSLLSIAHKSPVFIV